MTHHNAHQANSAISSHSVSMLQPRQSFQLDTTHLIHLFQSKPRREAEDIICRALEDIARRFDRLKILQLAEDFSTLKAVARRISAIASQIGLIEAEKSALHIVVCAHNQDLTAISATIARLERAFDSAVERLWEFHLYIEQDGRS